jgi:hypothetical protein
VDRISLLANDRGGLVPVRIRVMDRDRMLNAVACYVVKATNSDASTAGGCLQNRLGIVSGPRAGIRAG